MRSDHWNFLANLLGAGGSSGASKKNTEPNPPVAEVPKLKSEPKAIPPKSTRPSPVTSESIEAEPQSVDDVLEALRSVTPPQKIPGFGPPKKSEPAKSQFDRAPHPEYSAVAPERPRRAVETRQEIIPDLPERAQPERAQPERTQKASSQSRSPEPVAEADDLDLAWGSLANQLGVSVNSDFSLTRDAGEDDAKTEAPKSRDHAKQRSSEPKNVEPRSDKGSDRDRSRKAPDFGQGLSDFDSTGNDDDDEEEVSSKRSVGADKESEEPEERDRPRRRGRRRGVRQRMSEEDIESGAVSEAPNRGRSDSRRGRENTPSRETVAREPVAREPVAREKPERERPPQRRKSEFGGSLFVDDSDDDLFEDDDLVLDDPFVELDDSDDDSPIAVAEEEEVRRPKRRRGRRGGRRNRSREDGDRPVADRVEDAKDLDEPYEEPFGEIPSFDDDFEDDVEVEVIRRSGRRPQEDRAAPEGERRGRPQRAPRDSGEEPRSPNRSRGRSQRTEPAFQPSAERPTAPTWLETVTVLVDANIENHKKTPARSGNNGSRGGRGGKRR